MRITIQNLIVVYDLSLFGNKYIVKNLKLLKRIHKTPSDWPAVLLGYLPSLSTLHVYIGGIT